MVNQLFGLHSARYPRKPRGIRYLLDGAYESRFSFCCATEGCRHRTTPPSVRFLGRKVYLGVIVILMTALAHGLSTTRRLRLIEELNVSAQTLFVGGNGGVSIFPRVVVGARWRVILFHPWRFPSSPAAS
jgi:hypothetical protein